MRRAMDIPPPASRASFADAVARWQKTHGRSDLPWQQNPSPYSVWLSEIMLQQTRASAVTPYYENFLRRWPNFDALARARPESVMAAWSGLGYYARARNLHAAAKIISRKGTPRTAAEWQALPGVGKSTAAAIAVFSAGERAAIMDGNVKRVLARAFAVDLPPLAAEKTLWRIAEAIAPAARDIRSYTQGMMDLGATVCAPRNPRCSACPLARRCAARQRGIAEQLPQRAQRGVLPRREIFMALAFRAEEILLQKRPSAGIWGGLWSLPEAASAAGLRALIPPRSARRGDGEFIHDFSHFRLRARVAEYDAPAAATAPSGCKWISVRALPRTALPAPVRKHVAASLQKRGAPPSARSTR